MSDQIRNLTLETERLRERLEQAELKLMRQVAGKKVLGFTVYIAVSRKKGKDYRALRAHRYVKGQTINLYIGKDPARVLEVIEGFVKSNPQLENSSP